ncbi:MAG: D-alanyl-D-alanine carboxypeptidase [Deltaproteobacteria bacterium]|nr:D-alanyl-D-alanine carboxypeptidase [Deltaproteobacteria bacterium]
MGSNGGKGHFRLLVAATLFAFLLSIGAQVPDSALGADTQKKVTGTEANIGLNETQTILVAQKKSGQRNKKRNQPRNRRSQAQNRRNQEAKRLEETANLPWPENVSKLAGSGAVLVQDRYARRGEPKELFALNPDQMYVPASILKLVTAAAALDILGPDRRFETDFALDDDGGLWVVGRGDPFLVSEELCSAVEALTRLGLKKVGNIYLDTSYFEPGLVLDGLTNTNYAYDAYTGALGVNFNTVNYLIDKAGQVVEYNDCTPLTPITIDLASKNRPQNKKPRPGEYRINISESPQTAEKQSGQLIKALLEKSGVVVTGEVVLGGTVPASAMPLYTHVNSLNLEQMVTTLLEHSNNFMTNQIFLIMGAETYGPPANAAKSIQAVFDYLGRKGVSMLKLVEGSGLSRNNSLSARQMSEILSVFESNRHLTTSNNDKSVFYKTGTMSDIQTLAGYLIRPDRPNEPLSFVILLNGKYAPGTREKILAVLKAHFIDEPQEKNSRKS